MSLFFIFPQANLAIQEGRHRVAANELDKAESQLAEKEAEFQVVQAKCDAAVKEKQVRCYKKTLILKVIQDKAATECHLKMPFSGPVRRCRYVQK